MEHFDQFIVLATVGLGLVLAGSVNLVVGTRTGRRTTLSLIGSLTACGAIAAVLSSLTRGELGVRAGALMGGVVVSVTLVTVLFRFPWFHRQAATVVVVLWGLLTVSGLALALGSVIRFDRSERAIVEANTLNLEYKLGRQPHQPTGRARAVTDRGEPIILNEPMAQTESGSLKNAEEKILRDSKMADQLIRHGKATDASNCHGWIFTGGKFLLSPDDVEVILRDNGYAEIQEPQAGDVVIYRQGERIAHSAIVLYVTEGQPVLVEGKWGALGVFLHSADKSVYGTDYTFHRSGRRGHLLVGLGGISPDPTVVAPVVAE